VVFDGDFADICGKILCWCRWGADQCFAHAQIRKINLISTYLKFNKVEAINEFNDRKQVDIKEKSNFILCKSACANICFRLK
jgi:hypothetical protein